MRIAVEIVTALLAVWGLYCALKLAAELWLAPEKARPVPTVRLDGSETDEELETLARCAGEMWVCRRGGTVFVLPEDAEAAAGSERRLAALGLSDAIVHKNRKD